MEQKKNTATIFVYEDLQLQTSPFTKEIRVPFAPKTVTISNLSYVFDPDPVAMEGILDLLSCDIVRTLDGVLGVFYDGMVPPAPLTLPCDPSVNGFITFRFTEAEVREGDIAFCLTFED